MSDFQVVPVEKVRTWLQLDSNGKPLMPYNAVRTEDLAHTITVLARQIESAGAHHQRYTDQLDREWCTSCISYSWPCPTARALGVES